MLRIKDITYSVAGRTLLENTTVTIPTGHNVSLVGRNGTGKTTLFRIIRGEMIFETGDISMQQGWKTHPFHRTKNSHAHHLTQAAGMKLVSRLMVWLRPTAPYRNRTLHCSRPALP